MQPIKKSFSLPCLLSKLFIFIEFLIYEISNPISVNDDDSLYIFTFFFPNGLNKIPRTRSKRDKPTQKCVPYYFLNNGSYIFGTDPIR